MVLFVMLMACNTEKVGEYAGRYNSDVGVLDIAESNAFSLLVATETGCNGEVEGVMRDIGENGADYVSESCSLSFMFEDKAIRVIEQDCVEWHGMACSFEGIYQQQ